MHEKQNKVESVALWEREWGGKISFSHGESNSRGVAILIQNNIDIDIIDTKSDKNGRYILVHCKINAKSLILLNIYCPTKDKPNEQMAFLDEVNKLLSNYNEDEIIVGGDLNTYLDENLDKKGNRLELKSGYTIGWNGLMENLNLVDIWRLRKSRYNELTLEVV